jgi:hypothetical protein
LYTFDAERRLLLLLYRDPDVISACCSFLITMAEGFFPCPAGFFLLMEVMEVTKVEMKLL